MIRRSLTTWLGFLRELKNGVCGGVIENRGSWLSSGGRIYIAQVVEVKWGQVVSGGVTWGQVVEVRWCQVGSGGVRWGQVV